ncbi:hypothetical protein K474DRAFT_1332473 [Panus rudis PR-1116 ss-1]|nr:hypothetical protein K474DRAFT_1332473 [Panus rudis PR-1116 ss-1]
MMLPGTRAFLEIVQQFGRRRLEMMGRLETQCMVEQTRWTLPSSFLGTPLSLHPPFRVQITLFVGPIIRPSAFLMPDPGNDVNGCFDDTIPPASCTHIRGSDDPFHLLQPPANSETLEYLRSAFCSSDDTRFHHLLLWVSSKPARCIEMD